MIQLNAAATAARLSCRAVERAICEIWSRYFGRDVSPYDDFFDLGGDSLTMIDFVAEARGRGLPVRSSVALRHPTPAQLAEGLTVGAGEPPPGPAQVRLSTLYASAHQTAQARRADWTVAQSRSVPIVADGEGGPLYVVHSDSHVEAERSAVSRWGATRPVNGFPLHGVRAMIPPVGAIAAVANEMLTALRAEQSAGPYRLAGFGLGAVLAFELARQLRDSGAQVALLALIGPPAVHTGAARSPGRDHLLRYRLAMLAHRFGLTGEENMDEVHARVREDGWYDAGVRPWDLPWLQLSWADTTLAVQAYEPGDYHGPVLLFEDAAAGRAPRPCWMRAIRNAEVHRLDYGIESPLAVIDDAQVALAMRKALDA